jgi:hypothetical protein
MMTDREILDEFKRIVYRSFFQPEKVEPEEVKIPRWIRYTRIIAGVDAAGRVLYYLLKKDNNMI